MACYAARHVHRSLYISSSADDAVYFTVRRIQHRLADVHLLSDELVVLLPWRELNGVVLGIKRLDDGFAGALATAGASRDLRDQLKRPLGRPEVRHRQAYVRRDHSHERDAAEVVPFGNHLRADQD